MNLFTLRRKSELAAHRYLLCILAVSGVFNEDTDTPGGSVWSRCSLYDITLHFINLRRLYDQPAAAPGRRFGRGC